LNCSPGCNLPLNEWLGSPVIYSADQKFLDDLLSLVPAFFNPRKGLHHYLSMGAKTANLELQDGRIKIKKLFYILRPFMAACWIRDHLSMPPTAFGELLRQDFATEIRNEVETVLARKTNAIESTLILLPASISNWINETKANLDSIATRIPVAKNNQWERLNAIFQKWII
jgi:uncharacterized protein